MADVSLEAVEVPADAIVRGGANALEQMHRQAAVLAAVETVGAMDALLTMTVEYAKDRIAFGRPIGSFQALKHLMADLRSEEHTSELQSLMRISSAVFCLKKNKTHTQDN